MRSELLKVADSLGIRHAVARGRDQLVEVLTGSGANSVHRRNRLDDMHVKLLLSFSLKPDSNCLDVGAHHGWFLNHFRRLAPAGHHIAYEPLPDQCQALVRQFPEMDIRQRALSSEEGVSQFVHVRDAPAYSGLKERPYPKQMATELITVRTERLDDHVPEGWLPDFVKIDVEGAEALVIEGGLQVLRRAKPVVAFEHGCGGGEQFGASDDDMFNLLCHDVGLRLFDMDGHGPLGLAQFNEELATGERWNWIAHE
jgi:FkbM family methyltransferase